MVLTKSVRVRLSFHRAPGARQRVTVLPKARCAREVTSHRRDHTNSCTHPIATTRQHARAVVQRCCRGSLRLARQLGAAERQRRRRRKQWLRWLRGGSGGGAAAAAVAPPTMYMNYRRLQHGLAWRIALSPRKPDRLLVTADPRPLRGRGDTKNSSGGLMRV